MSASQVVLRDTAIAAAKIDGNDIACPGCGSTTLVLHGLRTVEAVEFVEAGKTVDQKVDLTTHSFDLEVIECYACNTRWHLRTQEVMDLEEQNAELQARLVAAAGKDSFGQTRH